MKKMAGRICTLLRGMLFAGFSIQILLGVVWMCLNFIEVQDFGQPEGFLYPLLFGVFRGIPQLLYLLQLGLAGFSAYVLLKPILPGGWPWRIWYVLALLTLPMALQCHLALLPCSLVSSLLFLELGCCREAMGEDTGKELRNLACAGVCWLGLAALLPEYGWLGLLPLTLTVLLRLPRLCRNFRRLAYSVMLIAAFGGIIAGFGSLSRRSEGHERTFWFSMASRMTWPTIWVDSERWSPELMEIAGAVIWETSYDPTDMERVLQPVIEDAVGQEKAQAYYREMAELSWSLRKARIIRQIGWDVLIYTMPQAVLQQQLEGVGYDSYSGRNYEIMAMEHPVLTKYYVDYGCWWFVAALGISMLLTAALAVAGREIKHRRPAFLAVAAVSLGGIALFYAMRGAGIADYKYTLAVSAVWTVWAAVVMERAR